MSCSPTCNQGRNCDGTCVRKPAAGIGRRTWQAVVLFWAVVAALTVGTGLALGDLTLGHAVWLWLGMCAAVVFGLSIIAAGERADPAYRHMCRQMDGAEQDARNV